MLTTGPGNMKQQQPSVCDLLVSLLAKVDRMEQTLAAITSDDQKQRETLQHLQGLLGVPSAAATNAMSGDANAHISTDEKDDGDDSIYTIKPRQSTPKKKRHREGTQQTSQQPPAKKIMATDELRLLQTLPKIFVNTPRVYPGAQEPRNVCENDIAMAIRRLAKTSRQGVAMLTFLGEAVDSALRTLKGMAPYEHHVLSWSEQDPKIRDQIIDNFEITATEHKPSIPLSLCEHNWISEYLLSDRWDRLATFEKKKRARKERRLQRRRQRLLDHTVIISSSSSEEDDEASGRKNNSCNGDDHEISTYFI